MKFTGQVRIPDIDHPGVPATFVIEGVQAEVILEGGEPLGRWSLFDVQARRLISAAFQVELDGEEVTFIADEPIDFAYRGVEKMAQVWAKFKSMNIVRRAISVSRSRRGALPSRIAELRSAMEENLGTQPAGGLAGAVASPPEPTADVVEEPVARPPGRDETVGAEEEEPTIPLVSAPASQAEPSPASEGAAPSHTSEEAERLAAERKAIEEERERLEEQRRALEQLQAEAEKREQDRVEAFRLEMKRLEEERLEYERLEEERQASMREAMEKLEAERGEIEKQSANQEQREKEDFARAAALRKKMAELETERVRREQEESERVAAAQQEMERIEEQKRKIESLEKLKDEEVASVPEPDPTQEPEITTPEPEEVAPGPDRTTRPGARHVAPVDTDEAASDDHPAGPQPVPEEPVPASINGDRTVVDLGELESEPPDDDTPEPDGEPHETPAGEPDHEPAMAGASRQGGIMGAVRAAFGRGAREHTHDFVDAPGGIGIARSICQDCGYVSITTED